MRVLTALFLLFLSAPTVGQSPPAPDMALRDELRRLIGAARDEVFPALVSIRVSTAQYRGGREHKGQSVGSGSIISPEGLVITNQHVTQGGRKFTCTLSDKREVPARLVGEDPLTDLALLQLKLEELEELEGEELPVARFGDSTELEIGDYVMAMGSPLALSRSVSLGIVSNTERVFPGGFGSDDINELELESGQRTGLFTRWIQHDALINPGNSGGPLVNLKGEIVGINELGSSSMGFAIPSNLARRVVAILEEESEVPRAWIGVSFKPIQGTGFDEGVLISSVVIAGPAAAAGIQAGDVLLALQDDPLTVRFPEEVPLLMDRVANQPIGAPLKLRYRRGEDVLETEVLTRKLAKDLGDETALPAWGFTAREITERMARELGLDSTHGALVSSVRLSGPAQTAAPALGRRDRIVRVGSHPVESLDDLVACYEVLQLGEDPSAEVMIQFERRGSNQLTLLEPRVDEEDDPPRELPKAWIGVATQPIGARLAGYLGLDDELGFRVTRVYPGSQAQAAGLQVGDLIVTLGGEALEPRGLEDGGLLARHVRALTIGDRVKLDVRREDERLVLDVELERTRLTPEEARRHRDSDFEITVRELTFFDRDANRWNEEVRGVLVENLDLGGWAGLGGLRPSDVVLRIDDRSIRGIKSFRAALKEIKRQQPEHVEVVVLRGVKTRFQFIEPDWIITDKSRSP